MPDYLERRVDDLALRVAALEGDVREMYVATRRAAFDAHCRSIRAENDVMDLISHLARALVGHGMIDGAQLEWGLNERVRQFEAAGSGDRGSAAARLLGDLRACRKRMAALSACLVAPDDAGRLN